MCESSQNSLVSSRRLSLLLGNDGVTLNVGKGKYYHELNVPES